MQLADGAIRPTCTVRRAALQRPCPLTPPPPLHCRRRRQGRLGCCVEGALADKTRAVFAKDRATAGSATLWTRRWAAAEEGEDGVTGLAMRNLALRHSLTAHSTTSPTSPTTTATRPLASRYGHLPSQAWMQQQHRGARRPRKAQVQLVKEPEGRWSLLRVPARTHPQTHPAGARGNPASQSRLSRTRARKS